MSVFTRNDKNDKTERSAEPLTVSVAPVPPPAAKAPLSPPKPEKIDITPVQVPTERKAPMSSAPVTPITTPSHGSVSVISKALKITGQLESTEDIQIEGEIDGDVRGVSVKVGSNAKVKGSVYGEAVELSGTVDGKIEAKKVVLTSTARMCGDVIHQDITIQSGAFIDGHCKPEFGKADTRKILSVHKTAVGES
jgi:cytoskeletal protein CcmA (bactofilin family)